MLTPHFSPVLLSLFPFLTNAATLFAAQSNGDLSTLSLTRNGTFHHLSIASNTREAGGNPSWLTLDAENRILYCLDRGQSNATKGSLNSFAIGEYGALSRIDTVDAPFSGVAAAYIDINSTTRGYVTAS
jgi:6-phosphogluconolactonase (cycloisomerase 2 family)